MPSSASDPLQRCRKFGATSYVRKSNQGSSRDATTASRQRPRNRRKGFADFLEADIVLFGGRPFFRIETAGQVACVCRKAGDGHQHMLPVGKRHVGT